MANSAGFLGRAFHRDPAVAPPLVDLLPPLGRQLRMRVEPRLAALVGTVVASLRAAGVPPVPVTDLHGRRWAPAYVLGKVEPDGRRPGAVSTNNMAVAEVVLDGSGRLVRNHPVQVVGGGNRLLPVSCPSLADRYEQFILAARTGEEARGEAVVLTRSGALLIAVPGPEILTLEEYLHRLVRAATQHQLPQ